DAANHPNALVYGADEQLVNARPAKHSRLRKRDLLNRDGGRVPLCNRSDDVDSCEADLTINLRVCADGGGPVRDHLLYQRAGVLKTRHAEPRTQVMIN